MAHECPICCMHCHCGGDIDDIFFDHDDILCSHCNEDEDDYPEYDHEDLENLLNLPNKE